MKLKNANCFLLDLDGTVYLGGKLIDGAIDAVEELRRKKCRVIFLTNNSSRSKSDYVEKLRRLGLNPGPEDVYTAGSATADYLALRGVKECYLLGTEALKKEFADVGVEHRENAVAVVVGFDTSLTYAKLDRACSLIRGGAFYVATHPDLNCPTDKGYMPDVGSFIALIKASTGRMPDVICGKPHAPMAQSVLNLTACGPRGAVMVGDRLYTDMAFGLENGMQTVLVLSGETTRDDYERSNMKVTAVVDSIAALPLLI